MYRYRVKEIETCDGVKRYIPQRRLFGFLFWYNILDICCGYCSASCRTLDEAILEIKRLKNFLSKKTEIVYTE